MVLGDVVQVVGHRTCDVAFGVVLQGFEDGEDRRRVGDQRLQVAAPGQPRTNTLGAPATHVRVGVRGEFEQPGEGLVGFVLHERPHRELRGEALGEFGHRRKRGVQMPGRMVRDELPDRPLAPALGDVFAIREGGRQAAGDDRQRFGNVVGQSGRECVRELPHPVHHLERVELACGPPDEGGLVERGMNRSDLRRHVLGGIAVPVVFEGGAFALLRHKCLPTSAIRKALWRGAPFLQGKPLPPVWSGSNGSRRGREPCRCVIPKNGSSVRSRRWRRPRPPA